MKRALKRLLERYLLGRCSLKKKSRYNVNKNYITTSGLCYKRTTDIIYELRARTNVRDYERQIDR
jgi:hypothetical protein